VLRRNILIPDAQVTWMPAALWGALRHLRRMPADILFSTFPPASSHLLALVLKHCLGIPWVADFRDAWTFDPLDPALVDNPFRGRTERHLEAAVLGAADLVVTSTEISADYFRETYPEAAQAVTVVTNGFDPLDFPPVSQPEAGGPLRIVHTGSFALSHQARNPRTIFGALERLLETDPNWSNKLELDLYGQLTATEQGLAKVLCQSGMVKLHGPCSRDRVLRAQQTADLLLLVDHPRSGPASNVPTKLYEYLGAGRPILAICDPGMVTRLLDQTGAGMYVPHGDVPAAAAALVEAYHRRGYRALTPPAALYPYHRRVLTQQLARHFDRVLEGYTPVPVALTR
jgi:glycosyltransferase involved in cell wall biosynthesis